MLKYGGDLKRFCNISSCFFRLAFNIPYTGIKDEQTQNHSRRVRKRQTVPEMNWGELDEVVDAAYPEFSGPEHGPVHNFDVDSEPVAFFDQLFTNKLWDLLVTETNRYARQANVNG